jgi:hypothetical protein
MLHAFPSHPLFRKFCTKQVFYGEELLAPCTTHEMEDHSLLAICSWLSLLEQSAENMTNIKFQLNIFPVSESVMFPLKELLKNIGK